MASERQLESTGGSLMFPLLGDRILVAQLLAGIVGKNREGQGAS